MALWHLAAAIGPRACSRAMPRGIPECATRHAADRADIGHLSAAEMSPWKGLRAFSGMNLVQRFDDLLGLGEAEAGGVAKQLARVDGLAAVGELPDLVQD